MSCSTYYCTAKPSELVALSNSYDPLEEHQGFESYKFFDMYNHRTLASVLSISEDHCPEFKNEEYGDGGMVHVFPQVVADRIAVMSEAEIQQLASNWGDAMVKAGERWTTDLMLPILNQLQQLIREAKSRGLSVLHYHASIE